MWCVWAVGILMSGKFEIQRGKHWSFHLNVELPENQFEDFVRKLELMYRHISLRTERNGIKIHIQTAAYNCARTIIE